jgi:hypothetical protein
MAQSLDPVNAIEHELQGERASALGEAGRRLEKELSSFDGSDEKLDLLATAVWHYLIVRECCGMYDHTAALAIFGVPPRVMSRVGVIRR